MKKTLIVALPLAFLLLWMPGLSHAQSQASSHFHDHNRALMFGFGLGVGGVSVGGSDLDCATCQYNSFLGASFHLRAGRVVVPRLALMGEFQINIQNVKAEVPVGMTTDIREAGLFQNAFLAAAQFWATPRLWVKGGVGFAKLLVSRSDPAVIHDAPQNGVALLGAVGFELLSRKGFAIDLQARLLRGAYDFTSDSWTSASLGFGFNWY